MIVNDGLEEAGKEAAEDYFELLHRNFMELLRHTEGSLL